MILIALKQVYLIFMKLMIVMIKLKASKKYLMKLIILYKNY